MLRDNLVGLIEPMLSSAGANPLALRATARKKLSDDRPHALKIPAPKGAESTLTENALLHFTLSQDIGVIHAPKFNVIRSYCTLVTNARFSLTL
jgi:hypothetical protein